MIPAQAVEAAAKAMPCLWRPARVGHPTHRFCEDCRNQARLILEAAAPHMLAQALDDAADSILQAQPTFVASWLRARAANIRTPDAR